METPLSTRRITRSMAKNNAAAPGDASHPRPALHDITNDSPIVGLAAAGLTTPASTAAKTRPRPRRTPGSGEALLRGQVKTLLQKVDEDACAASPSPNIVRIHALLGVARSPAHLLAPTPANTPHLTAAAPHAFTTTVPCVLEEEELLPKLQVIAAALPPPPPAQAEENLGDCNRALLFEDSPGKSDQSNAGSVVSSFLAFQDSSNDRSPDDDSSSAWSIQVNASSEKGDEDTFTVQDEEGEEWLTEDECFDDDDDECFDDLCEGMSKMYVFDDEEQEEEEKKVGLPAFQGKHTRFIYDSDGEMEREDVAHVPVENCRLVLRGLPVPEGKHLRFHEEEEDSLTP